MSLNPGRQLSIRWNLVAIGLVFMLALAVMVSPLQAGGASKKPVTKAIVLVDDGAHLNVRRYPSGYAEVIYQLSAKAEVTVKGIAVTDLTVTTPVPPTPEGAVQTVSQTTTTTKITTTTVQTVQTGGYTVINNSPMCGGNSCIILPGIGSTPLPPQASSSGRVVYNVTKIDNASCSIQGWAVDGTNTTAIVQILIDGQPAGNFLTVLSSPDAVAQTNVNGTHGFGADLGLLRPAILDGKGHVVAVVLLGANGQQTALGQSQTITCPASGVLPSLDRVWVYIDYVPSGAGADNTNCGEVAGWVNARYLKFYSTSELVGTATVDELKGWDVTTVMRKVIRTDTTVSGRMINLTFARDAGDQTIYTANATVYICNLDAGANLKVHSGPNLTSASAGAVQLGASGTVRGRTSDYQLVYVEFSGMTGYVPSNYLCVQSPAALCAAAPTAGAPMPVTTAVAPVGGNTLDQGTPIPVVTEVTPEPSTTEVTPAPAATELPTLEATATH